ncbi:MAG: deaminase [bacterium]|nr:deaminase [bacterium]
MSPAIVTYIPVLHEGYRQLFSRHPEARTLFLFGEDVIESYAHLSKDIRRLDSKLIKSAIESWNCFDQVEILNANAIKKIQSEKIPLIVSDDDITSELIQAHFSGNEILRDTIFLRWDKKKSIEPTQISPDVTISEKEFDQKMIETAKDEGQKSKDWWRRIGAIVVKNGEVLFMEHNRYVPSDQTANDEGDPRGNFKSGEHFESSLALHAEATIVARAAKEGISLSGTDVYCDTFPCPPCAKQLAYSGITRLYYQNGYNVLDGERILRSQGVKIIFVKKEDPSKEIE